MSHATYINLASRLLRQLLSLSGTRGGTRYAADLLAPLGLAQLAYLGCCPQSLPGVDLIRAALPGKKSWRLDPSDFGQVMTRIASNCQATAQAAEVIAVACSGHFDELLADPCMLGWLYQLLLREEVPQLRKGKEEIAPELIASATQWFTPEWVGKFLVDETLGSSRNKPGMRSGLTVLDPACGAGHLLITALRHLVEHSAIDRLGAMESALRDSLFGFDIDPLMIELAGLALYLESRALLGGVHELPIPNLYLISDTASGVDEIGSLWLGVDDSAKVFNGLIGQEGQCRRIPTVFDVVVANPPYLSHRMMPPRIASFLKEHYASAQYDLYAAFLSMAMRVIAPEGRLAMICQQSFLSIQRYEKLRSEMIDKCSIEAIAQIGTGAFAAKAGEKVNNAIIVLRRTDDENRKDGDIRFWRLLDSDDKSKAETLGLANLTAINVSERYVRDTLRAVQNAPIALWCPAAINQLFLSCEPMEDGKNGIVCTNGLFTCDNKRFVKRCLDVGEHERHLYVPYDKGGGHKWYRTTPYMLRWEDAGEQIRLFRKSRGQAYALPGEDYYFRSGVTYSYIGTRGFKARMLSPNSVFDIASSAVFSERLDDFYILGFLNSALVCFLLGVLNPTINFQIGDLRRLPFVQPDNQVCAQVSELVAQAIALAQELEKYDPSSPMFEPTLLAGASKIERMARYSEYQERLARIDAKEAQIQAAIDLLIFDLYQISEDLKEIVMRDPWVVRSRQNLCKPLTLKQFLESGAGLRPTSFASSVADSID